MKYDSHEISSIAGALLISNKIVKRRVYDWIDVVGLPQRPTDLNESLYFATHADGTDGWHNPFDRRPTAAQVATDKGWDLAVERAIEAGDAPHIVVSSLLEMSRRLYEEARRKSDPYIVGVTGSVGKTTIVAFVEHLLQQANLPATRFWSKRLSPLLVQCHYINRVDASTKFVTMEYSAYGYDHVAELSRTLPPSIAFLTNIYDMHMNPGMFRNQREIFGSKIRILPVGAKGYVNRSILANLGLETPSGWEPFSIDTELPATNLRLPPTLRTAELHTVGRLLANEVGISSDIFLRAFLTFEPKERRIISVEYNDSHIFFDGEVTVGARQWSWFETVDGTTPVLMVDSICFGDEDPIGFIDLLRRIFASPDTYVLDTTSNRELLPVSANFVKEDEFSAILRKSKGRYLVYHKAMATRDPNFDPDLYLRQRWG